MAKRATTGRKVPVKGTTAAEKKQLEAVDLTRSEDTAEAKVTKIEKAAAVETQLAKADRKANPRADKADGEPPEHTVARMAVSGF